MYGVQCSLYSIYEICHKLIVSQYLYYSKKMPLNSFADKKVLIIRFSSIGDIVLTTPVIRCLKQQTGAKVHFISKKNYASILESNPYIDKIFTIKNKIKEVLPVLKEEKYDYLIDLHKNLRSKQLNLSLGVKSYSFDKINFQKWLMVNTKINRLPHLHIVDRYMEAVAPLEVVNDGQGLDYFIPDEETVNLNDFFGESPVFNAHKPFIAFAIGAAHSTKRLPKEKIISICKQINEPIVLLGGPDDESVGAAISQALGARIWNACGQCTLHESASLIAQASQVITHDTGMMHIAAALGKPIISVWGNTIPEFGMYPYYKKGVNENSTIEVKGLSCRPCSKIGFESCPKGHFKCMKEIDEQTIVDKIELFRKK